MVQNIFIILYFVKKTNMCSKFYAATHFIFENELQEENLLTFAFTSGKITPKPITA